VRGKIFTTATMALALNLLFASAALAHGGVDDGHSEGLFGVDWSFLLVPPEFVLGGVALAGALYALKQLRG
jgi:hypothetical protein